MGDGAHDVIGASNALYFINEVNGTSSANLVDDAGLASAGAWTLASNVTISSGMVSNTTASAGVTEDSAFTVTQHNVYLIVGKLSVGEWMFMPVGGHSLGVQLQSSTGTINAEYAYWTKG